MISIDPVLLPERLAPFSGRMISAQNLDLLPLDTIRNDIGYAANDEFVRTSQLYVPTRLGMIPQLLHRDAKWKYRRITAEVLENPIDDCGLLDAGDDRQATAALRAGLDIDSEHAMVSSQVRGETLHRQGKKNESPMKLRACHRQLRCSWDVAKPRRQPRANWRSPRAMISPQRWPEPSYPCDCRIRSPAAQRECRSSCRRIQAGATRCRPRQG